MTYFAKYDSVLVNLGRFGYLKFGGISVTALITAFNEYEC